MNGNRQPEEEDGRVSQLMAEASDFLTLYYRENHEEGFATRLEEVKRSIYRRGTYQHTFEELEFGVRVAWRNSNRCVGRLHWKSIRVLDQRALIREEDLVSALFHHLETATNGGKIIPTITVFAPEDRQGKAPVRIWNPQLIRYAGYRMADGSILGDPINLSLTEKCRQLGWQGKGTAFDVLPLVIQLQGRPPYLREIPASLVLEVPLEHPRFAWFKDLELRWHAVPFISDMVLRIGGINYPAAPFNGWYMGTEIGSRNLGDEHRYNVLPLIADKMGLQTGGRNKTWKDRAMVELNEAVLFSFEKRGASIVDHHQAAQQFLHFEKQEHKAGREVTADWAWIVPPTAASATGLFHREWSNRLALPNFFYNQPVWDQDAPVLASNCPFHIQALSPGN
jgi:nitric-oxide synthase